MQIQDEPGGSLGIGQGSRPITPARSDRSKESKASGWSGEDRLELSERARALAVAKEAIGITPVIQEDKVDHIKNSIKNGSYHVPSEEIASRMLGEGFLA